MTKTKLIALLSLLVVSVLPASLTAQSLNSISIGVILPLSGENAFWGINPKRGIDLALRDIKHEAPEQAHLHIIYEDDQCDPKRAVSAFHKLVNVDNVRIILGPSCSSAALAVAPLAAKHKVLLFPFAEADSLSHAGEYIFRLWIPNGRQARSLARFISESGKLSTAAILSIKNAYGETFSSIFADEFAKLGRHVSIKEEYLPENRDLRAQLLRIKAKKPEALMLIGYIPDSASIVHQAKALGLSVPLFGCSTLNSPDFFGEAGEAAEGMVIFDLRDLTQAAFRSRWREAYGAAWPGLQSGAPLFYDITRLLAQLTLRHGADIRQLRQHLLTSTYSGISMKLQFDEFGDLVGEHQGFRLQNKALVPIAAGCH